MEKIDFQVATLKGVFSYRAGALIMQNNKLLVAKHIDHDCYYTVGGGVMLNETSAEAVVREVFEETGYILEVERLLFVQERFTEHCGNRHHEIVFFYLMKPNENLDIVEGAYTDQPQKESLHWLSIDKLPQFTLVPEFLKTSLQNIDDNIKHIVTIE